MATAQRGGFLRQLGTPAVPAPLTRAAVRGRITTALLLAFGAVGLGVGVPGYEAVASGDRAAAPGEGPAHVDRYGDPLPPGAVARLGTLRFRHQHTVSRVAFTDGGRAVLSASWDGTVRLWEADTGREIRRFPRHDGLTSPAFSPDGKTVAGVADPPQGRKTIRLWDLASGEEVRRIDCPENVDLFRFSPDGALLATRAARVVRLWGRATGKEVGRISLPEGGAGQVAFSADGQALAAVCADGTIRLWEVPAGREVKRFPSPQGADVGCLAFAPDGRELACGGGQADRTVRLLDVGTGQEVHRFGPYGGWVESVAFSPDGRRLATGDQRGRIRVYDLAAGRELCRCGLHDDNWVMALAFSPDGKTLAAGGTNEKAVRFFDAATGEELHPSAGHQDEVTGVALLPGGDTVVSAGRDGPIAVWTSAGGRVVRQWQHPGGATSLALSPDGKTLATGGQDGTARIWDVATGREVRRITGPGGWVSGVAFSADGTLLGAATGVDPTICVWDVTTGQERLRIRPPGQFVNPLPFAFSPDGKTLVSGTGNQPGHPLCVWDMATGKELRWLPGHPDDDALCLAFSPDGRLLASASWSETVRLTEVATGQSVREFKAYTSVLTFSDDGRTLASGGVDGTIHLWDLATGRERLAFRGHSPGGEGRFRFASGVSALAFSADGKRLASGGGDTTVLLWDLSGLPQLGRARAAELTPRELDALWEGLSSPDAARGQEAVWALVATPEQAVQLLAGHLRPVTPADPRRVAGLLAGLDSDRFEERDEAARELGRLGERALPALRQALAGRPSPEVRRRLWDLLERLDPLASRELLRGVRAVQVLEHVRTPDARDLLRTLADGVPEARITQEAKASHRRLDRRLR